MPGAPVRRPRPKGIFRRNRGLLILVIDVVLIAILAIIYRQFLWQPPYSAEIAGYHVRLRGFLLAEKVMVELQVRGPADGDGAAGVRTPERVFAVFRAGDVELRASGILPAPGDQLSLSASLLGTGEPEEVRADVRIGDSSQSLRRSLERD